MNKHTVGTSPGRVRPAAAMPGKRRVATVALAVACTLAIGAAAVGQPPPGTAGSGPARVVALRATGVLDGPFGEEPLVGPEAVALDHRDNIVIADTGNHRIVVVSPDGDVLDEFGGYGWEEGQLDSPSDLSVYLGFYTYVLDEGNRRVVRYDAEGDYVDRVVPEDEAGSPVAMAVGPAGGLYLVDSDSQSVLVYSQFDEELEPVGSFGLGSGGLTAPSDVAVGPSREIAVADVVRGTIEVFDEFGTVLYSLASADTMGPEDVAFGPAGNVFVADARHARILVFAPGGGPSVASLESGDPPTFRPTALAVGRDGRIVALDRATGRIQLIETDYGGESPRRP